MADIEQIVALAQLGGLSESLQVEFKQHIDTSTPLGLATGRTLYKLAKDSAGASTCKVPILKNGSHTSAECYSRHAKSGLWKPAATGLANGHSVENP